MVSVMVLSGFAMIAMVARSRLLRLVALRQWVDYNSNYDSCGTD